MDGVHPRERSGLVREIGHGADVRSGSHRVRGRWERDDAGAVAELLAQEVEVEREIVAHVGDPHDDAEVLLQVQPWRNVPVVIEGCDHNLVAGPELAPECPCEEEVERRHALPEATSAALQPMNDAAVA